MKKLTVILMALALAMAVLTSCAGNTGNDLSAGDGGVDVTADEPVKTAPSVSETEVNTTELVKTTQSSSVTEADIESDDYVDAINAETATASGECGDDLKWYYKDGVLVIKGTGKMTDYYSDAFEDYYAPWVTYNDGEIKGEISWVILGDGVTSVGSLAFYGLDFLSKAELPDTLERIGEGAFYNCGSLTSIDFPESLKEIGEQAFEGCALTSITIPATIEELGRSAFGATDITLCEGLTEIDLDAFYNAESITIPASVTKIDAFRSQRVITFLGDAPEIPTWELKNSAGEVIGVAISGLDDGLDYETSVTIYYSGEGFEKYIEMCPQYNWVKK